MWGYYNLNIVRVTVQSRVRVCDVITHCLVLQVFFRAGVLGTMEEIRDDRLGKVVGWLQSFIRGLIGRKEYLRLQEQRVSLVVVQRNLRKFMVLKNWTWFNMWQKVKPLLSAGRIEDEIRDVEEKAAKAWADYENEIKMREELEISNAALKEENNNLMTEIDSSKGNMSEFLEKQAKLSAQKLELEVQFNVRFIFIINVLHIIHA